MTETPSAVDEPPVEEDDVESPPDSFMDSGCLRGERRGSRIRILKVDDTCTCELDLKDMDIGSARKIYPLLAGLSKV